MGLPGGQEIGSFRQIFIQKFKFSITTQKDCVVSMKLCFVTSIEHRKNNSIMSDFIPLEKDPKWSDYTWESFQEKYLPQVALISTVHPEVLKQYRAIRKLMARSYFEHEFFNMAAGHMTMLVEMAMVWKYEQVTGEPWQKKTKKGELKRDLKNLFDWLTQNGHFSKNYPTDTNILRQVRNYYAHPKRHVYADGIHLKSIIHLVLFINELYDPNLQTANRLGEPIANWLKLHEAKSKALRFTSGQVPLSAIFLAFIDLSDAVPQYYFAAFPLFDFKMIDLSSSHILTPMCVIQVAAPKINSTSMSGTDVSSGDEVSIEFADPSVSKFINEWHQGLLSYTELCPKIPFGRIIQMQQFVEDLKTRYYKNL
jgi:hypothetical protein